MDLDWEGQVGNRASDSVGNTPKYFQIYPIYLDQHPDAPPPCICHIWTDGWYYLNTCLDQLVLVEGPV
jgi:hypothetical protein